MHDIKVLVSLMKDFLASGAPAHSKLEACADIIRLANRSRTPELKAVAQTFNEKIEGFTKYLIEEFLEKLSSDQKSEEYNGPLGLLANSGLDFKYLQTLAMMAEELDKTGDPELIKEASVLDEILLTLAAPRDAKEAFKLAEDKEVERLREKYRSEGRERAYDFPRTELERDLKTADAIKAIQNSIKEYRPLEAALNTRTCPDHPGAQMARVGDDKYQCSLDKKIYDYLSGFTTLKGNKVPGGDVSSQTQALGDRAVEHSSFDTRESKLNA